MFLAYQVAYYPCVRTSSNAPANVIVPNAQDIHDAFRENQDNLEILKWQYFGTEQGATIIFPATPDTTECGAYDPRFRPWYAETATSIPKDIVLLIDRSGSMRRDNRLQTAKDAAKTVVETLNPNDKVCTVTSAMSVSSTRVRHPYNF